MRSNLGKFLVLAVSLSVISCSRAGSSDRVREVVIEREAPPPPGVVEYVWEEPMVDVVDVPPGLDPEGHYYRPAHQAVVEIRQGKWRHYKFPESK